MQQNKILSTFMLILFLISCREELKPRPPVYHTYRHDFSQSVIFNKALYNIEQKWFDSIMHADTSHSYMPTGIGMWWYRLKTNEIDTLRPKEGDVVTLTYALQYINGDTIYDFKDTGIRDYVTDKEEYFFGFREAVKLLREGEEGIFLVPSYAGYGLLGDGDQIPGNTPLRLHLKILKITEKQDKNEK